MSESGRLLNSLGLEGAFEQRGMLGSGPVSESWLLSGPDGLLVLRRDLPLADVLGLDRQSEWTHLQTAYAADLGPEPVARDFARGVLVTRYLEGTAWARFETADWGSHGLLLRRVHELPSTTAKHFDPVTVARRYRLGTTAAHADALLERVVVLATALEQDGPACLCHHDAHRGNIIGTAPARLIDWEYAAYGDPLFDLAVVCRFHDLQPRQCAELLAGWALEPTDQDRFRASCELYDAIAMLWQLAVSQGLKDRPD